MNNKQTNQAITLGTRVFIFALLAAQSFAAATTPCANVSHDGATAVRFTHVSVEQGLSQSTVVDILQDHVGFMWFATDEGLNRYDGYSFVVFRHNASDPKSLSDDVITALLEDHKQQLWVGTQHGLSLFDRSTGTFTRIPAIHAKVNSIIEDRNGALWVGTEGQGLLESDPGSDNEFISHRHLSTDPMSLVSDRIVTMLLDREGQLWIGTSDGGVDMLATGKKRFIHYQHEDKNPHSLSSDDIAGVAQDGAGSLWIATAGGGLNELNTKTGFFRTYRHDAKDPHSVGSDLLTYLFTDRSGTLWIGTSGGGLQKYDGAADHFLTFAHDPLDSDSLSKNVVRTIYQDVQGQLWIGTYTGGINLMKSTNSAFCYFTHNASDPTSLANGGIVSFLESKDGQIWVGTEGGWLHRFVPTTGIFTRYLFPSSLPGGSAILSLHQDHQGRIWVGSYEGGLGLFDPAKGAFTKIYKHVPGDTRSISNDEIWAMAESMGSPGIWLGTNGGLDLFDPEFGGVMAHYEAPNPGGPANPGIRSLLPDKQGNLWVGTMGGLNVLSSGNFTSSDSFIHFRHNDQDSYSLSDDGVISLHEDRQGQIWVGTLGGLNRLDDMNTGSFTSFDEFPSNTIYGIQEEPSGKLWLSTNHGLVRFDPFSSNGKFDVFDIGNGLQTLQFHSYASLKTQSGRMLFGSIDGLYYFDPEAIKPDTFAPPVVLTSLRIFNTSLPPPMTELRISPADKVFSLDFAALDYTVPRRNRYAYILEGFSKTKIDLGSKHEVTFTNLDPGTYVLKIMASNSDGVWSDTSTLSLKVIVSAPFSRTWWFRLLCLAMAAFSLFTIHHARVTKLRVKIATEKSETASPAHELDQSELH